MTERLDLDELERKWSAASDGPWKHEPYGAQNQNGDYSGGHVLDAHGEYVVSEVYDPDGAIIAEARTAVPALIAELREARATIERVRALHKRSHAVFSWRDGLRFEDPCPDCDGKAGVHECGCWADTDAEFVCSECKTNRGGAPIEWPCPTIRALNEGRNNAD